MARRPFADAADIKVFYLLNQFDSVALDFGRSQVRFDISEPLIPPGKTMKPV